MGTRMHIHRYNRARRNGHTKAEFRYTLIEKRGVLLSANHGQAKRGTYLCLALSTFFASLRGTLVSQRCRGAQEDAVTLGTRQDSRTIFFVFMPPGDVVRDEIPGIIGIRRGADRC
jgi:hypothetical protein